MSEIVNKLRGLYLQVAENFDETVGFLDIAEAEQDVIIICRNIRNKAPIRFLLSCLAAKIDHPNFDVRKPYTQIEGDSFSGRFYDENYVQQIISEFKLPCNPTTAYLTPAFRNRNATMTTDLNLEGRPPEVYRSALQLLHLVHSQALTPESLTQEIFRQLIIVKTQNERRIGELLEALKTTEGAQPLSSEKIVILLQQHLATGNASRLPTLIVAAAYQSVSDKIGETIKGLNAHNAADSQTGAFGDIEVTLQSDDKIVTSYEMKDKRVTKHDIEIALKKIAESKTTIDNYIFITTEEIEHSVSDYAKSLYDETGIEFAILDCIGFIRHFLHFFHRSRTNFLNVYQELVIKEPDSAVSPPLKEAFLALRAAAETLPG